MLVVTFSLNVIGIKHYPLVISLNTVLLPTTMVSMKSGQSYAPCFFKNVLISIIIAFTSMVVLAGVVIFVGLMVFT